MSGSSGGAISIVDAGTARGTSREGMIYGFGAYIAWGFAPLYFRLLDQVPPWVIVCHRVLWSVLFLIVIVSLRREWGLIRSIMTSRRNLTLLAMGAVFIALNWLIFIYAINSRQILQASLGYFINPLLSIALGMIFLGERLRTWQWVAVFIAAAGVANLALQGSGLPWLALSLAASFGLYGLVRKKLNLNSLHGLLIESSLLLPIALVVIARRGATEGSAATLGLLSLSGIITAVPLLMFGAAVTRLRLSTMGFLQYVGPTLQFLVAILLFHEPLERAKLTTFVLCWLGIAIYVVDSVRGHCPQPVADEPE